MIVLTIRYRQRRCFFAKQLRYDRANLGVDDPLVRDLLERFEIKPLDELPVQVDLDPVDGRKHLLFDASSVHARCRRGQRAPSVSAGNSRLGFRAGWSRSQARLEHFHSFVSRRSLSDMRSSLANTKEFANARAGISLRSTRHARALRSSFRASSR